jgi:hypothetical protein
MLDRIPIEADWDNWEDVWPIESRDEKVLWDIDMEYAKKRFLDKSIEDCFSFFDNNFMACIDEFYVMPRVCFRYYIFALAKYLNNIADLPKKSDEEFVYFCYSDAASCFLSFMKFKAEHDPETLMPILSELWPYVEKVANHQSKYHADMDIYGDFKVRVEEIKDIAQKAKIKF